VRRRLTSPRSGWLLVALSGCIYSFDNPVAKLPAGTITGTLALQAPAAGQTFDGGTIKLAWSGLSVPLDATGRFTFLDLPDGTYTLVYTIPGASPADEPYIGVRPDVVVPDLNGTGDAVDLGTIPVAAAGVVQGTVVGGTDPLTVAIFAWLPDGGDGAFEGYSTNTADGGRFALAVPVGNHVLVASSATESAAAEITVAAASGTPPVGPLTLAPVALDGGGRIVGNLIFGGPGRGAAASGAAIATLTQTLSTAAFPPLSGSFAAHAQVADVGVPFVQPMLPGRPYDFVCTLALSPDEPDESTFDPLSIKRLPVVADRLTNLGPVPWLPRAVFDANEIEQVMPGWTGVGGVTSLGGEATGCIGSTTNVARVVPFSQGQALVWSTADGGVFSGGVGDAGGCLSGLGAGAQPDSLAVSDLEDGGALAVWLDRQDTAHVSVAGAQGWTAVAAFDAGAGLALTARGEVLFSAGNPPALELATAPAWQPVQLAADAGLFAGLTALAAVDCEIDGISPGLCLAWTGAGVHVAVADPVAGSVAYAAPLAGANAANPSLGAFVDSTNGTPYLAVSWTEGQQLWWAYVGSVAQQGLQAVQPVGGTAVGPTALLPWRGLPLAVFQPAPLEGMLANSLPAGAVPSPFFPADAGAVAAPAGEATDGGLVVGLVELNGTPTVFRLAP